MKFVNQSVTREYLLAYYKDPLSVTRTYLPVIGAVRRLLPRGGPRPHQTGPGGLLRLSNGMNEKCNQCAPPAEGYASVQS